MKKVLIVYHSQAGNTEAAAEVVAEGVRSVEGVEAVVKRASDAGVEDLAACDAVCVGTPDYFNYMAGMVKDFFDRTYYTIEGKVEGKPCGVFVTHGGGGKASESVVAMCDSFKLSKVREPVVVADAGDELAREALRHLGADLAEAVS